MIRITCTARFNIASPNAMWSCGPGANHFDEEPPKEVAVRLGELMADEAIKVENVDLDGRASPWLPPAKPTESGTATTTQPPPNLKPSKKD